MGGGNQIYLESKTDQIFSSNIFWSEIILRQENEWWGRHFPIFRFTLSLTHRAVYPTEGGPTWTSITELTLLLAIRSFQGEAGISTCSSDPVEGGEKLVKLTSIWVKHCVGNHGPHFWYIFWTWKIGAVEKTLQRLRADSCLGAQGAQ